MNFGSLRLNELWEVFEFGDEDVWNFVKVMRMTTVRVDMRIFFVLLFDGFWWFRAFWDWGELN